MTDAAGAGQEDEARPPVGQMIARARPAAWWCSALVAVGVLLAAEVGLFHPVFTADPTRSIAIFVSPADPDAYHNALVQLDQAYVFRLLTRNARTFAEHPTQLFHSETCFPEERSLALGEPIISHGLMATLFWIATGDPVLVFNLVQWLLPLIAGGVMFAVVRRWTGSTPGGLVAALAYGFSPVHNADMLHFYIHDTSFTVLAVYCADRWLESGRWRDALGLGAAVALQIGSSVYPLVAAALLGPPLFGWMIYRHGVRKTGWAQWCVVAVMVVAAALFVFLPYLGLRSGRDLEAGALFFMTWGEILPSGEAFAGWSTWLLLTCGVVLIPVFGLTGGPRARGDRGLAILLLILSASLLYVAAGGNMGDRFQQLVNGAPLSMAWPDPFSPFRSAVPGLDLVRAPMRIAVGAPLLMSMLAGLGASAVCLRTTGRMRATLSFLLVAFVFLEMIAPSALGLTHRVVVKPYEIRPAPDALAAYQALRASGEGGPIYEAPRSGNVLAKVNAVLHAAFHRERTSGCAASFMQAGAEELNALQMALPAVEAVRRLSELGFEAVAIHHPSGIDRAVYARALRAKLERQTSPALKLVATSRTVTTYAISLEADTTATE